MHAGVFKNWPNSDAHLVDVTRVEEMRVLKQTDVSQPAKPYSELHVNPPMCCDDSPFTFQLRGDRDLKFAYLCRRVDCSLAQQ